MIGTIQALRRKKYFFQQKIPEPQPLQVFDSGI